MTNKIQFRKFTTDSYPVIHKTFHEAFSDYGVDMSYMTKEVIRNRSLKNGIDYDLSVGAWDGDHLIGFTLVGADIWNKEPAAFDIMTGIIKPFRGKGIANAMFDQILPVAREKGIKNFVLEVLQGNESAINAYKKSGFKIRRSFNCYSGNPDKIRS
nr:GNAT family N-acetyltransferase [Bacteroidota bacterium]